MGVALKSMLSDISIVSPLFSFFISIWIKYHLPSLCFPSLCAIRYAATLADTICMVLVVFCIHSAMSLVFLVDITLPNLFDDEMLGGKTCDMVLLA